MMTDSHQNQGPNSIEQARKLLSPYMDEEATASERELLEIMLAQSPDLRAELDSLRQTVALVNDMPRVSAPRPFTLSEEDVGLASPRQKPLFLSWLKPFVGAAAALAALFVVGILFIFNSGIRQGAAPAALAPAAPIAKQQGKMEANIAVEPAAEMQKAAVPVEQPAAEMRKGLSAAETEGESEAAFSAAETALPPEAAATPLPETEAERAAAVERMEAGEEASKEVAAEIESLDAASDAPRDAAPPAEPAMEEAPVAMGALSGEAKSVDEMTAAPAESETVEEQAASEAVITAEPAQAIAPESPVSATLFAYKAAQEEGVGGEDTPAPRPAGVSPEASPDAPAGAPDRQIQLGAMALTVGLTAAGLLLALAAAIFLIIRKKK